MATKYFEGHVLSMVAVAAVAVGEVIPFADTIGVSQVNGEVGDIVTVDTEGVYKIPCQDATDFPLGARVSFDKAAKVINIGAPTATTRVNAGTIWEEYTHASGDGSVYVKING